MKDEVLRMLRKRELLFIRRPIEWPRWPLLPMKKLGAPLEVGFLFADNKPIVYKGSIYHVDDRVQTWGQALSKLEKIEFESFDAMLDAGWIID